MGCELRGEKGWEWRQRTGPRVHVEIDNFSPSGAVQATHILALLIDSIEAGNLLSGNGVLHAMMDTRGCASTQFVLVIQDCLG